MISLDDFEKLIERSESTILDFKASMYDFNDDADLKTTAKFVKDVISFSNTIRNETSYIVIGIEEKEGGEKILHGLSQDIDDSILQDKIKNKVHPRPVFHYYSIACKNRKFGILEFPKTKYSTPIMPTIKMKGIEVGKVYYRQGSSNTEALALEIININEWLKSLPEYEHSSSVNEEVNNLIKDLTSIDKKLSLIVADIYSVAQKYKIQELISFCSIELKGFDSDDVKNNEEDYIYRLQKIFISTQNVELNPYQNVSSQMIKDEFQRNKDFFEFKLMFSQSIVKIEELLKNLEGKADGMLGSIKMQSKDIFGDNAKSDYTVNGYFFSDTIENLYANIRQKAIDKLMKVNIPIN